MMRNLTYKLNQQHHNVNRFYFLELLYTCQPYLLPINGKLNHMFRGKAHQRTALFPPTHSLSRKTKHNKTGQVSQQDPLSIGESN